MGDPACWLHRTCPTCGLISDDDDVDQAPCPRCGDVGGPDAETVDREPRR